MEKKMEYIFHNSPDKIKAQLEKLREVLVLARSVPAVGLKEEGVWEDLAVMLEDMKSFDYQMMGKNLEISFYGLMLDQVNWGIVADLKASLQILQNGAVEREKIRYVNILLEFATECKLVLAVLGYYLPAERIIDVVGLEKAVLSVESATISDTELVETMSQILRFLSDSFFSIDVEARDWALNFMAYPPMLDEEIYNDKNFFILLATCVFIVCRDFSDLTQVDRLSILELFTWKILSFGVPLRKMLEKDLADQPLLIDYQFHSGLYAKAIFDGQAIINLGDWSVTIAKFMQFFATTAGSKEMDGLTQINFVDAKMKENHWSAGAKPLLLELINLYLHLRDMDLIDYRAWFSDSGLRPRQYDWNVVLQKDLSDIEKKEVEEYFRLLHMPTKLKMELLIAIRSVDWQTEPFFSRILIINDIFESVYSAPYSPLIFFDEHKNQWELNREIPDFWYRSMLLEKMLKGEKTIE